VDLADLALTGGDDGLRLRLRVAPGARRDGLVGVHGTALKLAVRAVAEKGRANEAVLRLLAEALGIPLPGLTLVAGASSRDKVVAVRGLDAAELRRRLSAALPPGTAHL
jgi:uncharacterized protein (TIGR00251 family)